MYWREIKFAFCHWVFYRGQILVKEGEEEENGYFLFCLLIYFFLRWKFRGKRNKNPNYLKKRKAKGAFGLE